MKVVQLPYLDDGRSRAHPYQGADYSPDVQYYDFKTHPELIRSSLEDFIGWSKWPAVETFYSLLEWLNGSESVLESNDCAFRPPAPRATAGFNTALECSGRLHIFFRKLEMNVTSAHTHLLQNMLYRDLKKIDEGFEHGIVGLLRQNTAYLDLPEDTRDGYDVEIRFSAFGETEEQTFGNLNQLFNNLWSCLKTPRLVDLVKRFQL